MLTTGVRLHRNKDEQRKLVAELAEAEVAALGFATGIIFKEVPETIVQEADSLGFPVIAVPLDTPFRDVIGVVNRSILSREYLTMQRLTSLQRHLLGALEQDDPRAAIVDRLAEILEASISLIVPGEKTEQTSGAPPAAPLVDLLATQHACAELRFGEWFLFATPMPEAGWLVAASRHRFASQLTKPVMQAAVPLLAASRRLDETVRRQREALSSALFDDLLGEIFPSDLAILRRRAQMAELDLTLPGRVAVIADLEGGPVDAQAAARAFESKTGSRVALATSLPEGDAAILVQTPTASVGAQLREFAAAQPSLLIGIGRETSEFATIRESCNDARQAIAQRGRDSASGDRVVEFDRLDLEAIVVASVAESRIRPKLDEVLGELREHPHLYEALVCYFEHDMDAAATAESLCLHTNSLRYRLGRIELLLGQSLKRPATIANLHLALSAERGLALNGASWNGSGTAR